MNSEEALRAYGYAGGPFIPTCALLSESEGRYYRLSRTACEECAAGFCITRFDYDAACDLIGISHAYEAHMS